MTSQSLNPCQSQPQQPFMLRDILPGPAWAPFGAAPTSQAATLAEPAVQGKAKPRWKAVLATVSLEAAIPIGVFTIWQVWMHQR